MNVYDNYEKENETAINKLLSELANGEKSAQKFGWLSEEEVKNEILETKGQ